MSHRRLTTPSLALTSLIGLLSVAVGVGGLQAPAEAQSVVAASPAVVVSDNAARPDAVSAMVTARAIGARVEDLSQRTETVRVFANPDGTWTSEGTTEPERVQDAQGEWHKVDTSLVERDGGLAPAYAASDVEFSAGGDKVFAALTDERGKRLEFRWPSNLPTPTVEGDTVTYPDALRGVGEGVGDLVVTATTTGFSHNILLRERPTDPVAVTIRVATAGAALVANPGGEIAVESQVGETLVAAAGPVMWDSSEDAAGEPEAAPVESTIGQTTGGTPTLTLSPDPQFLADPDTDYPVTVDPSFTINPTGDTWVQSPDYTSSQGASDELKVGTYDGGAHKARSFLKFDNGDTKWSGVHVLNADLKLRNFYSGSCTGAEIRASRITESWTISGLTWGNQPSVGAEKYDDASTAKGYNSSCPGGDVTWDLTAMVQGWHDGFVNNGLRLKAVDETSNFTWRRYRSDNYDGTSVRPRLTVDYNSWPSKPAAPTLSPGYPGYSTTTTPTFQAKVADPDKGTVRAAFEVFHGGVLKW